MMILCVTGASGHFFMIKALEISEASSLQPFSYLQLVFAASIGVIIFGEIISLSVYIGGSIIIASGLFTIWRERIKKQQKAPLELQ
ncbi:MAG: DMT family transporter [Alphaproteobacteria bacterium]|nr:DMT family transporter [Alphaproteobacteria bacterium]